MVGVGVLVRHMVLERIMKNTNPPPFHHTQYTQHPLVNTPPPPPPTSSQRVCPDVRARVVEGLLDGLTAVERKATAVSQLRTLNDQVSSGVVNPHHVDASGFKQTYARSVLAAQQVGSRDGEGGMGIAGGV